MATTGEFSWDVSLHSFSFQLPFPKRISCQTRGGRILWHHFGGKWFHPIKVQCCWCDSITFTLWQTNIAGWKMDPDWRCISYFSKGGKTIATVDGQNPAPPRMMIIPLFIGFLTIPGGCLGFCPSRFSHPGDPPDLPPWAMQPSNVVFETSVTGYDAKQIHDDFF